MEGEQGVPVSSEAYGSCFCHLGSSESGAALGPGYNLKGPVISHRLSTARPHPLPVTRFPSNWEPNVQTHEPIKDGSYSTWSRHYLQI